MIIKVQVTTYTTHEGPQVLAYDKKRRLNWTGPASKELLELMCGEVKAFFHAHLSRDVKFVIDGPAKWQSW